MFLNDFNPTFLMWKVFLEFQKATIANVYVTYSFRFEIEI